MHVTASHEMHSDLGWLSFPNVYVLILGLDFDFLRFCRDWFLMFVTLFVCLIREEGMGYLCQSRGEWHV